jgi:hypothetical protein
MNDQEFAAVSALPAVDRYGHFLSRVADWGWAWALGDDDGVVMQGDDDGNSYIAFWPHPSQRSTPRSNA